MMAAGPQIISFSICVCGVVVADRWRSSVHVANARPRCSARLAATCQPRSLSSRGEPADS